MEAAGECLACACRVLVLAWQSFTWTKCQADVQLHRILPPTPFSVCCCCVRMDCGKIIGGRRTLFGEGVIGWRPSCKGRKPKDFKNVIGTESRDRHTLTAIGLT